MKLSTLERERDEHNTREDDNDAGEKMFLKKKIKKYYIENQVFVFTC